MYVERSFELFQVRIIQWQIFPGILLRGGDHRSLDAQDPRTQHRHESAAPLSVHIRSFAGWGAIDHRLPGIGGEFSAECQIICHLSASVPMSIFRRKLQPAFGLARDERADGGMADVFGQTGLHLAEEKRGPGAGHGPEDGTAICSTNEH